MFNKPFSAIALTLACACAQASPVPDYPFVTATGKAEIWLKPDIGEIQFEINTQDQKSETAAAVGATIEAELLKAFADLGIAAADIDAFDVKKKSLELSNPAAGSSPLAYVIGRHIQLRVRDLAQWPALVGALLTRDNIDAIAVAFDRTDRDQINMRLGVEAAKDARNGAMGMAEAFGRHLGPVVGVSKGRLDKVGAPFGLADGASDPPSSAVPPIDTSNYAVPAAIPFAQAVNAIFKLK
jgi:uncharacterized protein